MVEGIFERGVAVRATYAYCNSPSVTDSFENKIMFFCSPIAY